MLNICRTKLNWERIPCHTNYIKTFIFSLVLLMGISLLLPVQSLAALGYMLTDQTMRLQLVNTHLIRMEGGIKNFLVETDVELIGLGENKHHKAWTVGITKPEKCA